MENNQPGKALYFSRNVIPNGAKYFYSHIGGVRLSLPCVKEIRQLVSIFLEKTERLEQLRALQNEINIWAVPVTGKTVSVDVKEDLKEVLKHLK